MPLWRCTTCAVLTLMESPCERCGGTMTPASSPRLPPSPTLRQLLEVFRLEAGNALLLRALASGHSEEDTLLVLAEEAEQEALQALYQGGILPDRGLSQVLEALVQARVEAFPRYAETAERAGHSEIATFLKWSASGKARGASLLARISH